MSPTSLTESPAILKRCTRCGVEKPVAEFQKQSSSKDGLRSWCKACDAARQATYREANREQVNARSAAYYHVHREYEAARNAAYRKSHPEKERAKKHQRRARKLNAKGTYTADQIINLLKKQRGKCVYCKSSIKEKYHIDHIMPLVKGGGNGIENLQLLCPTCNLRKNATDPIKYAQRVGLLL